jgi:hypothetical protein
MHHFYRLWVTLLVLSGVIALWFLGNAVTGIWNYAFLKGKASAEVSQWQVRELSSSRFVLEANYEYTVNGVGYKGHTVFQTPQFLNRFSAENYIAGLHAKRWKAWYIESNPSYSSMEREFPKKSCLQALLTIGVFAYFYFSRYKISKFFN